MFSQFSLGHFFSVNMCMHLHPTQKENKAGHTLTCFLFIFSYDTIKMHQRGATPVDWFLELTFCLLIDGNGHGEKWELFFWVLKHNRRPYYFHYLHSIKPANNLWLGFFFPEYFGCLLTSFKTLTFHKWSKKEKTREGRRNAVKCKSRYYWSSVLPPLPTHHLENVPAVSSLALLGMWDQTLPTCILPGLWRWSSDHQMWRSEDPQKQMLFLKAKKDIRTSKNHNPLLLFLGSWEIEKSHCGHPKKSI